MKGSEILKKDLQISQHCSKEELGFHSIMSYVIYIFEKCPPNSRHANKTSILQAQLPYGGKIPHLGFAALLAISQAASSYFFSVADFLFYRKTFHNTEPGKEKDAMNVTRSVGQSGVCFL